MMKVGKWTWIAGCALALAYGCQSEPKEPEVAEPPAAEGETEPTADADEPEPPSKSSPDCIGPVTAGEPKMVKVAGQKWELNGSTLTAKSGLKKKKLVVGAITDVKEDSPENLANLDVILKRFKKAKVDLVMVAGDTGLDKDQIVGVLSKIAESQVPVFNISGNREGKADYNAALAEVAKAHPNVFNLNQIRRIDTPIADFISMPGYFNASYIHAEDGCQYFQADVDALDELVEASDSPVVLVSHGGPKQSGEQAIDRTAEGANVGDPMLTKAIEKHAIKFGIFGNIHEAGGRATDFAGEKILPEGKPQESMFLNPGPADAVAWQMNDGSESFGMAAVMTIDSEGRATYEIKRIKEGEAKVAGSP